MTLALRRFDVRLSTPMQTARGDIARREGWLVGVESGGGDAPGVGEATPLPGWTESLERCRRALESVEDPREALETLADAPAARHGVALALADAHARSEDVPLAERLGDGAVAERVPVNATVGGGSPADTAAAAERAVAAGFDCLKVKVGVESLDRDVARLRAVRERVPDATLRVDANGAWGREAARAAVEELGALGVAYLEQPLPASDLEGHATLRGHGVDIALDESVAERSPAAVLAAGAADVLVLKPMVLGGPDRAVEAARAALDAGVDPVVTTTVDAAVARTAAVHVAASIPDVRPCGLATRSMLESDVSADPVPVVDGSVAVPTRPGLWGDGFDSLLWERSG